MQGLLAGGLDLAWQRLMAPTHQCISLRNFSHFGGSLSQQRARERQHFTAVRLFAATAGEN